jgi:hypothetical protein
MFGETTGYNFGRVAGVASHQSQISRVFMVAALSFGVVACASQAPRVSNVALGYAVTQYEVVADKGGQDLSAALRTALKGAGLATAMPAKANVTIDRLNYDSPIIGLFYGGKHYATVSVVLSETSGTRIAAFPIYAAANGERTSADADLAANIAEIIAAEAANAYMPIRRPVGASKGQTAKAIGGPIKKSQTKSSGEAVEAAPMIDVASPPAESSGPCVIGADGNCVPL